MPGSINVTKYLDAKDKHGVCVGVWAKQVQPGIVLCKTCVPESKINFSKGKLELLRHSETAKHIKNAKANQQNQPVIASALKGIEEDKETAELTAKAKDLEIALTLCMSRHNIPPTISDCVTNMLKKYVPDSKIIQKMSLGREKARYLTHMESVKNMKKNLYVS